MEYQRWTEGPPDVNEDVLQFLEWLEFPHQQQCLEEQELEAQSRRTALLQSALGLAALELIPDREPRREYKYPRNYKWFYHCVKPSPLEDAQYLRYFRMTRRAFDYLVGLIQDHPLITRECRRRDFLTAEEQLAIALRYCASGDSYESVGGLCGASRSSVHNAVVSVSFALFQHAPSWIRFPADVEEAMNVVVGFEEIGSRRWPRGMSTPGIPQVVGAMDGTQVLLAKKPLNSGDAYVNRKNFPALNVHAVADARLRFMDVNVGCAGRSHDSAVLHQSPLGAQLSDPDLNLCELFEAASVSIGGVDVPLQLLGDSAYPSRRYVLPAFKDGEAVGSGTHARFNDKHNAMRNVIERAFGVLKQRWRCLLRGSEASVLLTCWVTVM